MTHSTVLTRVLAVTAFATLVSLASASTASAQGFVGGYIGSDFSGDSSCPDPVIDPALADCEESHGNYGFAVGALGGFFGFEVDFGYSPNFFGEFEGASSSLLTMMGNVIVGPKIGPVQPYVLGGIGLMKTDVEITSVSSVIDNSNNKWGWDVGGGLMVFFGEHVGVRGDIRYLHAFQKLELLDEFLDIDIVEEGDKLDFGRGTIGVVFKF